ncbi:glycosyl hydrolase family 71-domain-containing protein [Rhodotorula diobovata]|uniref:Glycosyl hydrolase family 71-domain-containing protein n=1 Tax=Rhodotorula diobovata TaxID=5288 RepID=A0A5C5FTM8_9BASI|nr:glycosyl hydrolase family 71-domain-containing protein [Rhodotorula diobovata]
MLFPLLLSFASLAAQAHARAVIGHWMGGETQRYTTEDYAADMRLSKEVGIDAWAVNSGKDTYEEEHLDAIFEAGAQEGFNLTLSVDMLHWNVEGASDLLLERLKRYATRDEWFKLDGKPVLTTFNGAQDGTYLDGVSTFKESNDLWNTLLDAAAEAVGSPFYFAPTWLSNKPVKDQDSVDLKLSGVANWFGWGSVGGTENVTADPDASWHDVAAARGIEYWAPVGASFQVHQNEPDTNYCYKGGDFLLPRHYRDLIDLGDQAPDHIYLLTLTDWGESTYLFPVRDNADPPKGTIDTASYVEGHNHTAFALMSSYWNHEFKHGSPPTITSPALFWWHRHTPIASQPTNDPLGKDDSCDSLTDTIYAVVFVPEGSPAAQLVITTGGKATDAQTVQPGVNLISTPFVVGETGVSLQDADGNVLISGKGVPIVESTEIFDANYFTYAVPEDVLPSTFLDLGLDASSPSKASSSPTGTAGTPTSKPASTRAAASAGPAVSHAAVSTSASTSDESDTGAASESTSSHCTRRRQHPRRPTRRGPRRHRSTA